MIRLSCPECGALLVAKTQAAADFVKGCVDHPAPNITFVGVLKSQRCVNVGPHGRCELEDLHHGIHRLGEVTWGGYDKWNQSNREDFFEMGGPKDD